MAKLSVPRETNVKDEAADSEAWIDGPYIPKYSTSTYGADYPVESLVRRLSTDVTDDESDIHIPSFQRGYVWSKPQADRFIESLLLGLPVPGIFLWKDPETQRLAIIDGSQRLRTLKFFYEGLLRGSEFTLDRVHPDFAGRSYKTLSDSDRRRLDDSIIHASVVRQDVPEDEHSSIFYIFQRINTGGSPAQPQEIRNAIYQGSLNALLAELDAYEPWRAIYGLPSNRRKDQELILRFLALRFESERYQAPMKEFLNRFMRANRHASRSQISRYRSAFRETIDLVRSTIGRRAFRPERGLNAAVFDAVMVGTSRRLESGSISRPRSYNAAYERLLKSATFREATTTGTSQEQNVATRLRLAGEAFASVR